jgi:hypothetical protein
MGVCLIVFGGVGLETYPSLVSVYHVRIFWAIRYGFVSSHLAHVYQSPLHVLVTLLLLPTHYLLYLLPFSLLSSPNYLVSQHLSSRRRIYSSDHVMAGAHLPA